LLYAVTFAVTVYGGYVYFEQHSIVKEKRKSCRDDKDVPPYHADFEWNKGGGRKSNFWAAEPQTEEDPSLDGETAPSKWGFEGAGA
jgi:hypothetical protein